MRKEMMMYVHDLLALKINEYSSARPRSPHGEEQEDEVSIQTTKVLKTFVVFFYGLTR